MGKTLNNQNNEEGEASESKHPAIPVRARPAHAPPA